MTSGYDQLKPSIDFPEASFAMTEGLVAVGGKLDAVTLFHAYKKGIFPWPQPGYPMLWFTPERRGIIEFADIHVPKSLDRKRRKKEYKFTFDQDFASVIDECQKQPRKNQQGTWIVPALKKAYVHFHEAGFAHSVECWKETKLVGGIYGVFVEGVFSGESMFHAEPDTSKLALLALIDHLKETGLDWMDIQMVTPVTEALGGKYLTRDQFLVKLKLSQKKWSKNRKQF